MHLSSLKIMELTIITVKVVFVLHLGEIYTSYAVIQLKPRKIPPHV